MKKLMYRTFVFMGAVSVLGILGLIGTGVSFYWMKKKTQAESWEEQN